jgi:hypothetical protein
VPDAVLFAVGFFVSLLCAGFVMASAVELRRLGDEAKEREAD